MPAWSAEIANDLLRLAWADGESFDQRQLQQLVYIAHGWCLAATGLPLTGDRPMVGQFGPEYTVLTAALARYGVAPVVRPIMNDAVYDAASGMNFAAEATSELDAYEGDLLRRVYQSHAGYTAERLSALTREGKTPWYALDAGGRQGSVIPDTLIAAYFRALADEPATGAALSPARRHEGAVR